MRTIVSLDASFAICTALGLAALGCSSDAAQASAASPPPSSAVHLTGAASVSQSVSAADGGTITLGKLSLEIPPGALAADTELTITAYNELQSFFLFEPAGLRFSQPVVARLAYPFDTIPDFAPGSMARAFVRTSELDQPSEPVTGATLDVSDDGGLVVSAPLEHFSSLYVIVHLNGAGSAIVLGDVNELYSAAPASVPVPVPFTLPAAFSARATGAEIVGDQNLMFSAQLIELALAGTDEKHSLVTANPAGYLPLPSPLEFSQDPVVYGRSFSCDVPGHGHAKQYAKLTATIDATQFAYRVSSFYAAFDKDSLELKTDSTVGATTLDVSAVAPLRDFDVTCTAPAGVLNALGAPVIDSAHPIKAAWQAYCFFLSNGSSCLPPNPALALNMLLDPVISAGPNAAARLDTAFPCGDGPVGKTLCATPGTFAPGDYVFLYATFGGDIPLADPKSSFQYAFALDADGDASNNYVPPAQYPKDFFAGTDKWYQLFYTPSAGFSIKVVDARISNSAPVASAARLVIAGRELGAFIPRAELDGANPGFRATMFRHEGDYGLSGGPWDASYFPGLDEPLLPAAAGPAIVLPEN